MKYPVVITLFALLTAAACSTPRPTASTLLTPEEKTALMKRAKPVQTFGLTAYNSDRGPIFAGAFRQHQNHVGRVEFASEKNTTAPIIPIQDGKALLLIDSSAAESWLRPETATALNVTVLTGPAPLEKTPGHVYDPVGGFAGVLPRFSIEKLFVENGVFYIRNARGPLDGLTRWEKSPLDGVLGADFLRSFEFVRISLRGRHIVFSGGNVYPYAANAIATLPLIDVQGGLGVEAMVDGERMPVLIDLAGDFEFALEKPATPKLRQLTLGDIVFRQVEVDSAFELGLGMTSPPRIGRQLLERYDLVISQKGSQLLFERPTR
ncbi:MAG TPA: hypothetical protein PKA51_12520 [Kiritimatiellia bacterium]|nr:hypothetical protein [Kiritimatiellia bacterium]